MDASATFGVYDHAGMLRGPLVGPALPQGRVLRRPSAREEPLTSQVRRAPPLAAADALGTGGRGHS
ncbi:hypothetical protein AB0L59_22480 [Streptomyces sp. NPDC052109]|uniref:hypothetical protein n=1 Tax=Streptomyces sp. NPDC052109 TaxID=3155527 RepID=UPI00343EF05E